jgi:hypothetical protein
MTAMLEKVEMLIHPQPSQAIKQSQPFKIYFSFLCAQIKPEPVRRSQWF